jgi:alpha-tubulin suppressor-like RCC1 family protein
MMGLRFLGAMTLTLGCMACGSSNASNPASNTTADGGGDAADAASSTEAGDAAGPTEGGADAPSDVAPADAGGDSPAAADATDNGDGGDAALAAVAIAAGDAHTCALTVGGGVLCWGDNQFGQLGNNTTTDSPTPVAVSGLGSGVTAISSHGQHTCALTGGGLFCWGYNGAGELGDNSTVDSHIPVAVWGLGSGVSSVSAGFVHTCAVTNAGGAQCWGFNQDGELGDNATSQSNVPAPVSGLGSGVASVAAGGDHTCALTSTGGVQCWGYNGDGQLGNDTIESVVNSAVPVAVSGLGSGVAAIAAGSQQTCALVAGGVQCWGENTWGELGDNSINDSPVPIAVQGLGSGVAAVAGGGHHTCALTNAGGVECWGNNGNGQLGNNSTTDSGVPVAVSGLASNVSAVSGGGDHACALTAAGSVLCWGSNGNGQLGNNSTTDSPVPVAVVGF